MECFLWCSFAKRAEGILTLPHLNFPLVCWSPQEDELESGGLALGGELKVEPPNFHPFYILLCPTKIELLYGVFWHVLFVDLFLDSLSYFPSVPSTVYEGLGVGAWHHGAALG